MREAELMDIPADHQAQKYGPGQEMEYYYKEVES